MKKYCFLFLLFLLFISNSVISQTTKALTDDETARVKYAVHLITYDTVGGFDNAAGDAYYHMVIQSFEQYLIIPECNKANITGSDKTKIEKYIQLLNQAKQNPPTWDDLLIRETEYYKWLDKVRHKKSIYKSE